MSISEKIDNDWDYYEFYIGECFISAIINNDYTGLNDGEEKKLNKFLVDFPAGHWSYDDFIGFSEDYRICEVSGLYSSVMCLRFNFKKQKAGK